MRKWWHAVGPGQVAWTTSFMRLRDSLCPTCSSGPGNLLSEEPWPRSPTCYLSPSWVRTTCASCLTKSVTKALTPVAISGLRGSTWDRIGDLAFLAAVLTDWETQPREQGGVLCSPLRQETEESQNINPSLILPLIFWGSMVPYGLFGDVCVWPSNRPGLLVEPGQLWDAPGSPCLDSARGHLMCLSPAGSAVYCCARIDSGLISCLVIMSPASPSSEWVIQHVGGPGRPKIPTVAFPMW